MEQSNLLKLIGQHLQRNKALQRDLQAVDGGLGGAINVTDCNFFFVLKNRLGFFCFVFKLVQIHAGIKPYKQASQSLTPKE